MMNRIPRLLTVIAAAALLAAGIFWAATTHAQIGGRGVHTNPGIHKHIDTLPLTGAVLLTGGTTILTGGNAGLTR